MYEYFLRPILFRFDPERVHDFFIRFGAIVGATRFGRWMVEIGCTYDEPLLRTRIAGIDFKNPVGLGAGFDKDALLTKIIPSVGFGFMEIGAVTRYPYEGNTGKRLLRLPVDKALIVYYGLKSVGAEAVKKRFENKKFAIPVGVNIAKTNRADIKGERSLEDYAATYTMLAPYVSYVTLNVSCPNAQDGCMFQEPALLDTLLARLRQTVAVEGKRCPIFLKLSSHLSPAEVDAIVAVVDKYKVPASQRHLIDGFVIGNLSKRRSELSLSSSPERLALLPNGGISGRPVKKISTDLIRHIYRKTKGEYAIIGLGGIFTAEDAYEKIKAGASLVQIVTGLIYGGPLAVKRINKGLVALLKQDGFASISDAVGKEQ